jgi:hypothetical protein
MVKVDCPSGKILNPQTGRCVKIDGKIGQQILRSRSPIRTKSRSHICPSGTIINPQTGRCVKIDGKIGQQILRSRSPIRTKSRKLSKISYPSVSSIDDCDDGDVYDPKTGECVDKDSPRGKRLMTKFTKEFLELYADELLPEGYIIRRKPLGKGIQGTVYLVERGPYDEKYVLKVQDSSSKSLNEIEVHALFAEVGLAPRILKSKVSYDPPISGILMEKMSRDFESYLSDKKLSRDTEKVILLISIGKTLV